jgi:hypothetical protein
MKLREVAHSRTGDKGNVINISVIAYREHDYRLLVEQVTAERVQQLFGSLIQGKVDRYCIPALAALNFVLRRPEDESVTRSLRLDAHGKGLGFAVLDLDLELDLETGRP